MSKKLKSVGAEVLKTVGCNPARAADPFAELVLADCDLLRALMTSCRTQLNAAAYTYLAERANYMTQEIGGASQRSVESHGNDDRPADTDHRASQSVNEGQGSDDRPMTQDRGRASQAFIGSHGAIDRPVPVSAHSRGQPRTKLKAAKTRIGKIGALRAANAFDDRIGMDLIARDAGWSDWVNFTKKGSIVHDFGKRVLAAPGWSPNPEIRKSQRTPDVMSEEDYKRLKSECLLGADALGLTNVRI